jgi:hypothetical protein
MPQISQVFSLRSVSLPQDVFFVFANQAGDIKLTKISRTQLDSIATSGQQMNIINNATTILQKSQYGNGSIESLYLNADQTTGIVRLVIELAKDTATNQVKLYMGRIDQGNWVQCANTPITIDDSILEIQSASGNSNEVNVIITNSQSIYLEGH